MMKALLLQHGWTETAPGRYANKARPGEEIVARDDPRGWYHTDANGKPLGHSRNGKDLAAHLTMLATA
jgi:hypothetical protein